MRSWNAFALIAAMIFVSSCASFEGPVDFVAGFRYETDEIRCGRRIVNPTELLASMSKKIEAFLSQDEDLRMTLDVLDYYNPSLIGYKKMGRRVFVQYLFADRLLPDAMLPGEGGVNVVVDACDHEVAFANFFRYPKL